MLKQHAITAAIAATIATAAVLVTTHESRPRASLHAPATPPSGACSLAEGWYTSTPSSSSCLVREVSDAQLAASYCGAHTTGIALHERGPHVRLAIDCSSPGSNL